VTPISIEIPVGESLTHGILYPADDPKKILLILAHGAGAPQSHPFMVDYATALAQRGIDLATFNFLYSDGKRRGIDRPEALSACFRAAIAEITSHAKFPGRALAIGGKSMGGRYATIVASDGVEALRGVVCLGYPLHPPDKPKQLRTSHFPKLRVPLLFVQGTRDPFGSPDELRPYLAKLEATIHVVDGGDHSFKVPKRGALPQEEVHAVAQQTIVDWLERVTS
jgi:predicted alpha/beta-hydrolase family hydrolase